MNYRGRKPLLVIDVHCSQFVEPLRNALTDAGLWAFLSFDLRSTRALHDGCCCPHHGSSQCTCELVVLLVYRSAGNPITLILDGYDGQTFVFIAEDPGSPLYPATIDAIAQAIQKAAILFQEQDLYLDTE